MDYSIYFQAASLFALTVLFYKTPWNRGAFPDPLPPVRSSRREIAEVLLLYGVHVGIISYIFIRGYFLPFLPYAGVVAVPGLVYVDVYLVSSLVLPFVILRAWRAGPDRTALGFGKPVDGTSVALFSLLFAAVGTVTYFVAGGAPASGWQFAWWIVTPILVEELVYRAAITSKLERAIGIHKAWILGGVLFGLAHVPNNFFGYFWHVVHQQDFLSALGGQLAQIGAGFMLGLAYIKTRSLLPCLAGHYFSNYMPAILATIAAAI